MTGILPTAGTAKARGDAGDHLPRHPGTRQDVGLLAAPAEHEGIPPFSRTTVSAAQTVVDEELIDLILTSAAPARSTRRLADVHPLGLIGSERQYGGVDQTVVEDDIGFCQQFRRPAGQQARVPRSGSDEVDRHRAPRIAGP